MMIRARPIKIEGETKMKKSIRQILITAMLATLVAVLTSTLVIVPMISVPQASAQTGGSKKNIKQPFTSAARTATATSASINVGDSDTLVGYLAVTANSGTTPTLDVKFQDSPDGGTTWFDIAPSFTQVTTTNGSQ